MYPSGIWRGFWQQSGFGKQSMENFQLHFQNGFIHGSGDDIVGRFVFSGEYEENTGRVQMIKRYLEKHDVLYEGGPDGEGSILGTWIIPVHFFGIAYSGPFLIRPVQDTKREIAEDEFVVITR